ncbi:uncharacterized protein V6R79_015406 [Siganus canaliculatus]
MIPERLQFIQRFINSSWYDRYEESPPPQTVTMIWSLIISMYAVGGLFGAVSVKFVSGMLGRKKVVIANSVLAIMAAGVMVTSKQSRSYEMVIVARILYGYSAGLGMSVNSVYLAEISPRKLRGTLSLTALTFTSLGKVSGQFFGLSEILGREELWNIALCVPAFLAVVQVIVLPFLPEAPRYLFIEKGDDKACQEALQSLWGPGDYKEEMDDMLAEQVAIEAAPPKSPLQLLKDKSARWQLCSMSIIYFCNQMSGMNVISTFSFDIFMKAGIPRDQIRYMTLGLGIAEIITSISCGLLIEHTGRRPLFWGGYSVMSACWVFVTVTLNVKTSSYWVPYIAAALVILFILFFCGGPGGAAATLNNEIFIQSDRLAAFVLMGFLRWVIIALTGFGFPFLITALKGYCFVLFAFTCLLGFLFTFFFLPETKGKTLLEICKDFRAMTVCGKSFSETSSWETKL